MVILFNGALTGSFVSGTSMLMTDGALSIDFSVITTGGPTTVEWYPEFASGNPADVNTPWFREVAEEDVGAGVIDMPKTIRNFQENGGAALANGTHTLSAQLTRRHQFVRLQMRVTAGAASVVATAPFGLVTAAP